MSEQELNIIFAENLKRFIQRRGLSQADVSKSLGVSEATVSQWCSGKISPRMSKVDKLCELLQCTRTALMSENGAEILQKDDISKMLQDLYDKDHALLMSMADTTPEELAQLKDYLEFIKSKR